MSRRLFAIGDIHGCLQALLLILAWIEANTEAAEIVFLGDLIDRGPHSRQVIELLMAGPRRPQDKWIIIRGNHEQMMVDAHGPIHADEAGRHWVKNGGHATLVSYGDDDVPQEHLQWLAQLPTWHETEQHWFVHAGMYPGFRPENHSDEILMWLRFWEGCINDPEFEDKGYEKHVVYGHTPEDDVFMFSHCTCLDTGAGKGGHLSAAEFVRDEKRGPILILQVDTVFNTLKVREV